MKPAKEKKTYCTECGRKIIKWRESCKIMQSKIHI